MKNYETPQIEIINFQDAQIETNSTASTLDVGVGDWFEEGE